MILRLFFSVVVVLLTTSCLKTRAEVGESQQSQVYGKKLSENQKANSQPNSEQVAPVDDRDELIRSLNGRLETLENQIAQMNKAKEDAPAQSADAQKIAALQEALTKMEAQIIKLEADNSLKSADSSNSAVPSVAGKEVIRAKPGSSDANLQQHKTKETTKPATAAVEKKQAQNSYELGEEQFGKKEWKKAILSYQKYVEETPKGKSVPDAKYKIGVCFQELGLKDEAMAFYEEVMAQYGKIEAGKKAKIRLNKLKK